jgi:hypothetical protein
MAFQLLPFLATTVAGGLANAGLSSIFPSRGGKAPKEKPRMSAADQAGMLQAEDPMSDPVLQKMLMKLSLLNKGD